MSKGRQRTDRLAPDSPLTELSVAATQAVDGPPVVLLRYQQDWIADRSELKIGHKGRRVGLTWAEAADDVLDAVAEVDGCNTFYISAAQDMAREYIEAVALWTRAFDVLAGEIEEGIFDDGSDVADPAKRFIKTFEVNFPKTGRRIVALSSRPTNLRGKQGNIVLDEAAFAPDLAGLIKAAMAMILWGNRVKIISSHNGAENPFNELVLEIQSGKRPGSVHHIPFMRAVRDGLFRRVCLRRGKPWSQEAEDKWVADAYGFYGNDAEEELDAVPARSGGKYLPLELIATRQTVPVGDARCTIVRREWPDEFAWLPEDVRSFAVNGWLAEEVRPLLQRLNPLRRHAFGLDFARSSHLSVLTILEEGIDLVRRPRLALELRNCPFTAQDQIYAFTIDGLPRFRGGAADAGGNGAATAEKLAQRYGSEMVEQVKFSQGWYALNMPKFKAGLQDGTLDELPRDDLWRDDLRAIEVVKGIPMVPHVNTQSAAAKAAASESGQKGKLLRHGDAALSLVLADYAFRREAGEIAWQSIPAPPGMHGGGSSGPRLAMRPDHSDDMVLEQFGGKGDW